MAIVPTSSKPPPHPPQGLSLLLLLRLAVGWALLRGSPRTAARSGWAPSSGHRGRVGRLQLSWGGEESASP